MGADAVQRHFAAFGGRCLSAPALLMPDEVLGEKPLYLTLPQIPFPAPGQSRQLTGRPLSVGCALSLATCVCWWLSSAVLQHHAILSIATYPIENPSPLHGTPAVHPAWRYTSPKVIPDRFASPYPSLAAPFLTPGCTWVVS